MDLVAIYLSLSSFLIVPSKGTNSRLVLIRFTAGRGSDATSQSSTVPTPIRSPRPDLSRSSIVSNVFSYLIVTSVDRSVLLYAKERKCPKKNPMKSKNSLECLNPLLCNHLFGRLSSIIMTAVREKSARSIY